MSLSARNFLSLLRSLRSLTSVRADSAASRSDTPKDRLGEMRSFTLGTYVVRLFQISAQLSPGWTRVEYVKWPRPLPSSMSVSPNYFQLHAIIRGRPLAPVRARAQPDPDFRLRARLLRAAFGCTHRG